MRKMGRRAHKSHHWGGVRKELVSQALASGLWLGPPHPPSHSPPLTPLSSSRSLARTVPRPLCRRDPGLFSRGGTQGLPAPPSCPGHHPVSPAHPWRYPSLPPSPLPSTASLPGGAPGRWLSPCSQRTWLTAVLWGEQGRAGVGKVGRTSRAGPGLDGEPQTRLLEPGRCGPACDRVCAHPGGALAYKLSCPLLHSTAPLPTSPRPPGPGPPAQYRCVCVAALKHMQEDPDPAVSCLAAQTSYVLEAKEKMKITGPQLLLLLQEAEKGPFLSLRPGQTRRRQR